MRRRGFLTTVGTGLLAGCSGGPDGDGSEPTATGGADPTPVTEPTDPLTATESPAARPTGPLKGVSLSPRSFESADFTAFLERAAAAGTALRWAGDWAELADAEGTPAVVATLARQHGLVPVIDAGIFSVSEGRLFEPLTDATRADYAASAASFAAEHDLEYLGLGVEVNLHREADPESFETFVELFSRTRAAVAEASPETRVYVTFQYEQLRGLRGGLFGGENDPEAADWDLLDRFAEADLVGLTSYPGLVHRDPADVPTGYFDAIADRTDVPVAVTETGWTAEAIAEGWESDEAEQAAFVRRLFELVEPLDLELLLWLWLYEQPGAERAFRGMGLRRDDGSPRPAWDAWVAGEP